MVSDTRPDADIVFKFLITKPGVKHNALRRRFQNWGDRLDAAIDWLKMLGKISIKDVRSSSGPPATCYWAVEGWQPPPAENQLEAQQRDLAELGELLAKAAAV